jgi:hypothetical protein
MSDIKININPQEGNMLSNFDLIARPTPSVGYATQIDRDYKEHYSIKFYRNLSLICFVGLAVLYVFWGC